MNQCVLISGCSGGGKSTLLAALKGRGHATVAEPGRRIVAEERARKGTALPWVDLEAFARRAIDRARSDLLKAKAEPGLVFFDRGLVDAAVALEAAAGVPYREVLGDRRPYAREVFLAPPWLEIFVCDDDRRHDFDAAVEEFERLTSAFRGLGYRTVPLPKVPVQERAAFVLSRVQGRSRRCDCPAGRGG